jgi:RNA polymerase sigma factor (TIGR02999 family)
MSTPIAAARGADPPTATPTQGDHALNPSALDGDTLPERARGLAPGDVDTFLEIYAQLKPRAHQLLAGHRGETLNTTGLVHEAFIKLLRHAGALNDERHLYRLAVLAMRQILLDRVRIRDAQRHGGDLARVTLSGLSIGDPVQPYDVVLFDSILDRLRGLDARKAEVFELKVLGGLELVQIAGLVGIAEITVRRDFRAACTLVQHWLEGR